MRPTELKWSNLQSNKLLRIFIFSTLVLALAVAVGEFSATRKVPVVPLLIAIGALLGGLFRAQRSLIKVFTLQRGLLYLTLVAGFIGSAFLTVRVGPIYLFPYRVLLPLLWLFFAMGILHQGRLDISHIKVKPYLQFLGLWLVYGVLSLVWALSKADAIRHIAFLFMAVSVIFFIVYHFSNSKDLKRFYYLWLAVFGGLLLLGFWEHLTGLHLPVSGYYGESRARFMFRPTGVFHNPNDFATFLALSIPFALGLLRYGRKVFVRLASLGAAIGASYLIVVTSSRANILAVLLELTFLFAFLMNLKQKFRIAVVAAVCVAVLLFFLPGPVGGFFSEVTESLGSITTQVELGTGSMVVRMNLARNGLLFLHSTAGFGVGAGNAEYWMDNFAQYETRGVLNPHNWWLEIFINYGIFVFVGYILFYLGLVLSMWRVYRRTKKGEGKMMICEALLLALVGFFFASISSSSIMALKPQWLLFAFVLAFLNYMRYNKEVRM